MNDILTQARAWSEWNTVAARAFRAGGIPLVNEFMPPNRATPAQIRYATYRLAHRLAQLRHEAGKPHGPDTGHFPLEVQP